MFAVSHQIVASHMKLAVAVLALGAAVPLMADGTTCGSTIAVDESANAAPMVSAVGQPTPVGTHVGQGVKVSSTQTRKFTNGGGRISARHYGARTIELNLEPSGGSHFFHESRLGPASKLVPEWVDEVLAGQ